MARVLDEDELIDHWTLVGDQWNQVAGKRGATRLGFAVMLLFYIQYGRFPRGRAEIPDQAIEHVARQVGVTAAELGFYEFTGRTYEYHRAQIRQFLGFRECSVGDADKLTTWLAEQVCQAERHPERIREQLLSRCWSEGIEPPARRASTGSWARPPGAPKTRWSPASPPGSGRKQRPGWTRWPV